MENYFKILLNYCFYINLHELRKTILNSDVTYYETTPKLR